MRLKVRLRDGFSDRNNIKKENTSMQLTSFDERTRIELCNFLDIIFNLWVINFSYNNKQHLLRTILKDLYVVEISFDFSYDSKKVLETIKQTVREDEYDDVLTVIEFIVKEVENIIKENGNEENCDLHNYLNNVFEKEYVGYRYINGIITPITSVLK